MKKDEIPVINYDESAGAQEDKLPAIEKDDSLDMMGLGEHVDRLDFADGKTMFAQICKIPAQGGGIAGDVDQPSAGDRGKMCGKVRGSLAGWIDDHAVEYPAVCDQLSAGIMDRAFAEADIIKARCGRISGGAADGRSLAFNSQDFSCLHGQGNGKISHAAEQVEYPVRGLNLTKIQDGRDKIDVLRKVDLAKAAGFPAQGKIPLLAGYCRIMDGQAVVRGLCLRPVWPHQGKKFAGKKNPFDAALFAAEPFCGLDIRRARFAHQPENDHCFSGCGVCLEFDLSRIAGKFSAIRMGLQGRKGVVFFFPGEQANIDGNDGMGMESMKAQFAPFGNLQPDALAVAEIVRRGDRFGQQPDGFSNLFIFTARKQVQDDFFFDRQLRGIITMLQVASPA